MASEPYKDSDIYQKDIYGNYVKSTKDAIQYTEIQLKVIKELKDGYIELGRQIKIALSELDVDQKKLKSFERIIELQLESVKVKNNLVKLQNEERRLEIKLQESKEKSIKIQEKSIKIQEKSAKETARLRNEINKENKSLRDNAKRRSEAIGSLNRLRSQLNEARRRWDSLSKSERENEKVGGRLQKVIRGLDTEVRKLETSTGRSQRNVGNYSDALSSISPNLGQIATGAGAVVAGVQLLGSAIRSGFDIIKNFNQSQADLAAISGKTKEELSVLTEQAKELGSTTQFSATEITGLQIELAKLGFTTKQIQDSTGGIADFAAATGADIPAAAALAGSALRSFGLEANEIDRVVSTLGVATTKSALDFSKLEAGLSTVAPVAASFGFSIEDTTALLGQLSNAGFDASSSATATRNILLSLADANGSLAKELGRPIKSADDLAAGLQELQERGIDLGEALELTDKRSVAAFSTFIKGSHTLVELRDSITGANEELQLMAEKRLDSIDGQLTLLSSAWEGFILSLEDGEGVMSGIVQGALQDISLALQQITDSTGEAGDKFSFLGSVITLIKTNVSLLLIPFKVLFGILMEMVDVFISLASSISNFIGLTDELSVGVNDLIRVFNRLPTIVGVISTQIINSLKPLSDAFKSLVTLDFDSFELALRKSKESISSIPNEIKKLFESNEEVSESIEDSTEIIDKNTDAIDKNTKSKIANSKANDPFLANERRRIELIEDLRLKALESETLRFNEELKTARKNNEDLELVERIHQRNLQDIRDKFNIEEVESYKMVIEAERSLNTTSGDDLTRQLEEELRKREELREKQLEEIKKFATDLTSSLGEELQKQTQQEIEASDEEISNTENEIARQQSLADQGLKNTLVDEEENLKNAQLKKKELLEKERQQQEIIKSAEIFLTAYEARLNEDPNTALQKAFVDTFAGQAAAESFIRFAGSFKDGVENLEGEGTETSDSNLAWLSKGESVATAKATKENKGLVTAMNKGKVDDWFSENYNYVRGDLFSQKNDDKIVKEIRNLSKEIRNLPTSDLNGDKVGNIIQTINRGSNRIRVTHKINRIQ